MIHIVFGESATGSLKYAFRDHNHEIIGFPIDFSVGPITNIHENNGMENHFTWLKSSFNSLWGHFEEHQTVYRQSLQRVLEIKDGEQATIWTCENASEQIGLRIICFLLKDKQVELCLVNTFEAMLDLTKHKDVRFEIRSTGECSAEQLAQFHEHSTCPIPGEMRRALEKDGENLLQRTSTVRSCLNGDIIDEPESRDDSFIMECARSLHNERQNNDFMNAMRVIGEVLGHSEHMISDAWIEYRVRSLIHSGHFDYQGNLQSMRMYRIKLIQ